MRLCWVEAVLPRGPWPPAAVRLVAAAPGFELRHTTSTDSSARHPGTQFRQTASTDCSTRPFGSQLRQTASTDSSDRPFGSQLRQTTSAVSSGTLLGLIVPPVRRSGQRAGYFTNTWPPPGRPCSQPPHLAATSARLYIVGKPAWSPSHQRRRPVFVDAPTGSPSHPRWYRNKIVTKTLYLHNIIVNLYQDNLLLTLQLTNPMSLSQDNTEPFGFQIANTLGFCYGL